MRLTVVPLIFAVFAGCVKPVPLPEPTSVQDVEAEAVEESVWCVDLPGACDEAKRTGRPIFALFTGSTWCPPCRYLEKTVFRKKLFADFARERLVLLKFDVPPFGSTLRTDTERRAVAAHGKYRIEAVPTVLLLDADGKVLRACFFNPETVRTYLEDLEKTLEDLGVAGLKNAPSGETMR